MIIKLIIYLIIMLIGFFGVKHTINSRPLPQLPEGYTVLISDEGKFALVYPKGRTSASIWKTERAVIEFAIEWEKDIRKPHVRDYDKYTNWKPIERNQP